MEVGERDARFSLGPRGNLKNSTFRDSESKDFKNKRTEKFRP